MPQFGTSQCFVREQDEVCRFPAYLGPPLVDRSERIGTA